MLWDCVNISDLRHSDLCLRGVVRGTSEHSIMWQDTSPSKNTNSFSHDVFLHRLKFSYIYRHWTWQIGRGCGRHLYLYLACQKYDVSQIVRHRCRRPSDETKDACRSCYNYRHCTLKLIWRWKNILWIEKTMLSLDLNPRPSKRKSRYLPLGNHSLGTRINGLIG